MRGQTKAPATLLLLVTALLLASMLSGCMSYVHAVNQDAILPVEGELIEVEQEKGIWLRFNFDNDYVREAYDELLAQCPGGTIHGVASRLSSTNGFFHWTARFHLSGVCVK